ncbi:hypothetical protein P168DRAFT_66089 [Aspergillus campestris IBT 28561]|uniref:Uncharacterized protein n=1 Tax=Aspergillus campestris (strain IBT 28561) TaxID=1392248 RepID=A0A2I1CTA3_ASPC2|nr:uncharacterized protein P168DRAFT_66089 [Aspergillus campestris IBT 28561]PKY00866.1 hypothetical protein P168DRAFT_66089 [Aspergillus campestris IBT 28561]
MDGSFISCGVRGGGGVLFCCRCRCRLAEMWNLGSVLGSAGLVCWGVVDGAVSVIVPRWDGVGLGLDDDPY